MQMHELYVPAPRTQPEGGHEADEQEKHADDDEDGEGLHHVHHLGFPVLPTLFLHEG